MIDWQRVECLREEIGPVDFEEVVRLFLEEVDGVMARLPDHPTASAVEADLHLVKGCALNLGFSRLAELCHIGERRAAAGQATPTDMGGVLEGYRQSRALFLTGLQQACAGQIAPVRSGIHPAAHHR